MRQQDAMKRRKAERLRKAEKNWLSPLSFPSPQTSAYEAFFNRGSMDQGLLPGEAARLPCGKPLQEAKCPVHGEHDFAELHHAGHAAGLHQRHMEAAKATLQATQEP